MFANGNCWYNRGFNPKRKDEKILLIESLPDADVIIVIWFKVLCLAGKQNNHGVFMLNDSIPYTDEMLATIFRRHIPCVVTGDSNAATTVTDICPLPDKTEL